MGNSQSASFTRRHPVPLQSQSTDTPHASHPPAQDTLGTAEVNQSLTQENEPPRNVIQRRRSLMKFPSLRRRPRSVVGLHDQSLVTDPQAFGPSPPSRRRWRALSGLKSRPVSTLATSSSSTTVLQSQDAVERPITDPPRSEKGKERETDVSETVQADKLNNLPEEVNNDGVSLGPFADENRGFGPSSEVMLQELRDLQDTFSAQEERQADIGVVPKSGFDAESSRSQVDRPPTPMPPCGISPTSGSRGSDALDNSSPTALAEALGSWMGGRPRPENAESTLNDCPIASSSGSYSPGSSSSYTNAYNNEFNPSSSSRAAGVPGSSSSNTSLEAPNVSGGAGQSSSSPRGPTLPPAGTGTLVVVQGVVHTTDVRHPIARTPSTPRPIGASTHPPRSASSTPTLRTPALSPSSRSGSGASTPQAPSTPRRSRLSSFASGLRQRSRPHTPTSSFRTAGGASGWRHGAGESNSSSVNHSESSSDYSLGGLGLSMERSVSDSEAGSIALSAESSSTSPFVSTDDTSTMESADGNPLGETQGARDPLAPQGNPHVRNLGQSVEASTNGNYASERRAADDGERDITSDEESEAELSASSIEILGTLLSVATAATAASLVTGTTEPLFTSGLAGPPPDGRSSAPASQNGSATNPSSPFPRSNHPSTSQVGVDDDHDAAANTRMRAAWESLRERFSRTRGRRGGASSDTPGEAREDPREQMLREMARVFNMGLGLDAEGASDLRPEQQENRTSETVLGEVGSPDISQPSTDPMEDRSNRPVPEGGTGLDPGAEGSFERFLHNLQVDLRTALTEDYAARRARAQTRNAHTFNPGTVSSSNPLGPSTSFNSLGASSSSNLASVPSPSVDTGTPMTPESILSYASEGSDQDNPLSISNERFPRQVPDLVPTVPNTPRTANLDLPHLPGDTDPQSADGTRATPQAQGITGQPGAGINWWRLYRFPPMQLAPHPSAANADTSSAAGVPSSPSSPLSASSSQNPLDSQLPSSDESLPTRGPDNAPTQNVVPVIVVGLQSVPVNRADPHHHDPIPPHADRFPSSNTDESTDSPSRDRAWPLRAASRAFNRMGRRSDTDFPHESDTIPPAVNATENTGGEAAARRTGRHSGRTYLIFVIGGYYPPNHSIVTGADDMNSFEALWELADLLGQVKPPVASKEDIEKSGLEIIKSSNLSEYEKSGKVASNTVERCLICLDDYEPEVDLRLLSCRHVFHKACVDRWLEQGRNNCPACRSKGVQTGDDSTTSPSPMAGTPLRPESGS